MTQASTSKVASSNLNEYKNSMSDVLYNVCDFVQFRTDEMCRQCKSCGTKSSL